MDIGLKDKERREKFAKIVHKWTEDNARVADLTPEEAGKRVAAIMRVSLDAAKEVTDPKRARLHQQCRLLRSNVKDGYSPQYMALKDNYRMMKELVKLAFDGPRKITRKYWTEETYCNPSWG